MPWSKKAHDRNVHGITQNLQQAKQYFGCCENAAVRGGDQKRDQARRRDSSTRTAMLSPLDGQFSRTRGRTNRDGARPVRFFFLECNLSEVSVHHLPLCMPYWAVSAPRRRHTAAWINTEPLSGVGGRVTVRRGCWTEQSAALWR